MRWIFAMITSGNGIDPGRLAAVDPVGQPVICRRLERFRKRRFTWLCAEHEMQGRRAAQRFARFEYERQRNPRSPRGRRSKKPERRLRSGIENTENCEDSGYRAQSQDIPHLRHPSIESAMPHAPETSLIIS